METRKKFCLYTVFIDHYTQFQVPFFNDMEKAARVFVLSSEVNQDLENKSYDKFSKSYGKILELVLPKKRQGRNMITVHWYFCTDKMFDNEILFSFADKDITKPKGYKLA